MKFTIDLTEEFKGVKVTLPLNREIPVHMPPKTRDILGVAVVNPFESDQTIITADITLNENVFTKNLEKYFKVTPDITITKREGNKILGCRFNSF